MKVYQTSDLGLAAYLVYQSMECLGAAKTNSPRHSIVFTDNPDREQYVDEYNANQTQVDARKYAACIHRVNKELRNPVGGTSE